MASLPTVFGFGGGPTIIQRDLAAFGIIEPLWGIFNDSGESVVVADNVVNFEYKQEWTVADYPMEQGAFESYDKVDTPFSARITFSSGGSFRNRQHLLASIDQVAGDLKKYDVVTPEKTYTSVNIMHYDYRRTAVNGAGLITVAVWLTEIRENATVATTDTAAPSGAATQDGGQVQAKDTTASQQSIISAAFNAP